MVSSTQAECVGRVAAETTPSPTGVVKNAMRSEAVQFQASVFGSGTLWENCDMRGSAVHREHGVVSHMEVLHATLCAFNKHQS